MDRDDLTPDDRTLDFAAVLMAAATLGFAGLQQLHYQLPIAAGALVVVALMLALTPLVGRWGVPRLTWISCWIFVGTGGVSFVRGGVIFPVLGWLVLLPAAAYLIGKPRSAALLVAALVVMVGVLYACEVSGLAPEKMEATPGGALFGAVALVIATFVLGFAFRRSLLRALAENRAMERRLYQANKLEGIARLAGGVAHDFNNVLAVIASRARIITKIIEPDHAAMQDIESILAATQTGAELTRRLLAIGREGDPGSRPLPTDLRAPIEEASDLLRGGLPDDVVMRVVIPDAEVVALVDPQRIHQITMNLAINSRDAMPDGGKLDISLRELVVEDTMPARYGDIPPGEWVVLEVSDTGHGMEEKVLDRMLEPFFTTKPRDEGSGLGLSVVHGIVEGLGGRLDATSTPSEGTRIGVYLPRHPGAPVTEERAEPASIAPKSQISILLVEDDASVRKATERLLGLDGYAVASASSGPEALSRLETLEPDVLVTDVVMPEMSGPVLARHALAKIPDLAVIYLSGYAGDMLDDEDLSSRRVRFLQKPVPRRVLNATLVELVNERRATETQPSSSSVSSSPPGP